MAAEEDEKCREKEEKRPEDHDAAQTGDKESPRSPGTLNPQLTPSKKIIFDKLFQSVQAETRRGWVSINQWRRLNYNRVLLHTFICV